MNQVKNVVLNMLSCRLLTRLGTVRLFLLLFSGCVLCWTILFTAKDFPDYVVHRNRFSTFPSKPGSKLSFQSNSTSLLNCQLPKLDPFTPEIMKLVKKVSKPRCSGKRIGKIENNHLVVNAKNVYTVILYPVRRAKDSDFKTSADTWIPLLEHPVSSITNGASGCLYFQSKKGEFLMAPGTGNSVKLERATCYHNGIFQFHGDKVFWIEHVMTKTCVQHLGNEFKLTKDCGASDSSKFHVGDNKLKVFGVKDNCFDIKDGKLIASPCAGSRLTVKMASAASQDINLKWKLQWDGIILEIFQNGLLNREYHLIAARQQESSPSAKDSKKSSMLNVAMLMYDSQSGANFDRALPKTLEKLAQSPTHLRFSGHTIVGDGTTAQLCAMLTGVAEEELPEARRSFNDAQPVDRWPFIFKDLHRRGYVTLFSEDDPMIATFNYRLHGFRQPPTTHYGRPFWLQVKNSLTNELCLHDRIIHDYQMEYIRSLFQHYPDRPKFSLVVTSSVGHNSLNAVSMLDESLVDFLNYYHSSGMSKDTVLIIFGDHGARIGELRNLPQGKLEERLPYFSILLPEWFPKSHPEKFKKAKANTQVLTSHFDVYHTLMDIVGLHPVQRNQSEVGMSLFEDISSQNRHCADAGIADHWCTCLSLEPLDANSDFAKLLVNLVLEYIHKLLNEHKDSGTLCSKLTLDHIISVHEGKTSPKVRTFKGTRKNKKCDSCDVVYDKSVKAGPSFVYQIVFRVAPSSGIYEASLSLTDDKKIRQIDISRTNKYGSQPKCVQEKLPHLRPYCFCKKQS